MAEDSTSSRAALLELRLDMHVPEFKKEQEQFLGDLAHLLGVEVSAIADVSIRTSCTCLVISLPPEAARALAEDFKGELTGDRSIELTEVRRQVVSGR